jgi:hypothetical protein
VPASGEVCFRGLVGRQAGLPPRLMSGAAGRRRRSLPNPRRCIIHRVCSRVLTAEWFWSCTLSRLSLQAGVGPRSPQWRTLLPLASLSSAPPEIPLPARLTSATLVGGLGLRGCLKALNPLFELNLNPGGAPPCVCQSPRNRWRIVCPGRSHLPGSLRAATHSHMPIHPCQQRHSHLRARCLSTATVSRPSRCHQGFRRACTFHAHQQAYLQARCNVAAGALVSAELCWKQGRRGGAVGATSPSSQVSSEARGAPRQRPLPPRPRPSLLGQRRPLSARVHI